MGKVIRREFLGSRVLVTLLCLSLVGIPMAIIYVLEAMVKIEEDVQEPSEFTAWYRARKSRSATR